MCDNIKMFGHADIVLKGDGEPALLQVQDAIVERRSFSTVPQNPPAYDPQANGAVERGAQETMNQIRAIKIGLEQRLRTKISKNWKVIEWIVELSTVLINRCLVGHAGKTAYSRLVGKNASKEIVEIGERVLAKISRGKAGRRKQSLRSRWHDAIWVGIAPTSTSLY